MHKWVTKFLCWYFSYLLCDYYHSNLFVYKFQREFRDQKPSANIANEIHFRGQQCKRYHIINSKIY